MTLPIHLNRRSFITLSGHAAGVLTAAAFAGSAFARLVPTPAQTEGPFYPVKKPVDQDADLARLGPDKPFAAGDLIIVQGRVFDADGNPVMGALVEIWQANNWGRYQDRRDTSGQPWDPHFQGYGKAATGADGTYSFRTIRPAGYGQGFRRRTPHIHFRVTTEGRDRFTTQMYFAGEAGNESDFILNRTADKDRLIVEFQPGRHLDLPVQIGTFDIVV